MWYCLRSIASGGQGGVGISIGVGGKGPQAAVDFFTKFIGSIQQAIGNRHFAQIKLIVSENMSKLEETADSAGTRTGGFLKAALKYIAKISGSARSNNVGGLNSIIGVIRKLLKSAASSVGAATSGSKLIWIQILIT